MEGRGSSSTVHSSRLLQCGDVSCMALRSLQAWPAPRLQELLQYQSNRQHLMPQRGNALLAEHRVIVELDWHGMNMPGPNA